MSRFIIIAVVLAFLNGCAMWQRPVAPLQLNPGATAFSSGYSGGYDDGGDEVSGKNNWGAVLLGLGLLTAVFGGCFAFKTSQGEEICFSVVEGLLAD